MYKNMQNLIFINNPSLGSKNHLQNNLGVIKQE